VRINPWRGIGELPGRIWVVFAATLINRAGTMALPFLVLYLTQDRGIAPGQAGLAMLVYGLGSLVAGPLSGWLCDRVGPLLVIQSSMALSGVLLTLFPLAEQVAVILAITFLWAVVGEAYRPAGAAFVSDLVAARHRKAAFALTRLAANLGMSIGPLVGGLLASRVSYHALFWVDGATSILGALTFMAAYGGAKLVGDESSHESGPDLSAWTDRRLLYFMVAMLPVGMVFFQFEGALPLFMVRNLELSESVYGSMFLINTLLIVLIEIPLNLATSEWPPQRLLAGGALLTAFGFGGLVFATDVLGIAATIVVWTFGEMILMPNSVAYVANMAPTQRRGSYMGAYHVTMSLAFGVGPWIGTVLFDQFGAVAVWSIAFWAGALSAVMLWQVGK
jgi:predicted MFS family arabinose efflux permease